MALPIKRHIGLRRPAMLSGWSRVQRLFLFIVIGILVMVLLWHTVPAAAVLALFLLINVILEQHKTLTERAPIDIEILSVGTAYLSSNFGIGWGLTLAILGPIISHASIAYFGDATIMKLLGHLGTACAAAVLGTSPAMLLLAITLGMVVQFCAFVFILGRSAATNVIARITTLGFSAYVIYIILPHL